MNILNIQKKILDNFNKNFIVILLFILIFFNATTLYFAWSEFEKGSVKAEAASFLNMNQQISAAFTLAYLDGVLGTSVNTVESLKKENYLKSIPIYKNTKLELYENETNIIKVIVSDSVCSELKQRAISESTNIYGCINKEDFISYTGIGEDSVAFYKVIN